MRIVVAPSGFKESLGADEVADRIEAGVLRVLPDAEILKAPMVDGGVRPRTGLTLTRAAVEQHGGRFSLESEPGEGTYAQIRLPLRG